ncbi:molybdopterin oxidoreductase [Spirochaetia bacterium]|nr:molybdopterin oxidoreductase [Spirochaetia bacterium]
MRNLTCIVCPMGCSLTVEEGASGTDGLPSLSVMGNRCPRGAAYAQEEIRAPRRVVTATCGVQGGTPGLYAPRRVPVKTVAACPREKIPALLADIYQTQVSLPVKAGDTVIANWKGEGINVVAVRTLM